MVSRRNCRHATEAGARPPIRFSPPRSRLWQLNPDRPARSEAALDDGDGGGATAPAAVDGSSAAARGAAAGSINRAGQSAYGPRKTLGAPLVRGWLAGCQKAGRSGPPHGRVRRRGGGPRLKKDRPVAAIHYRKPSDSFQSRHKAGAGNRRVAMASCRSKVRVAVRALVKRRERPRRRVRRLTLSTHR